MPIDMKQHHQDLIRQMIGSPEIPDSVASLYERVKLVIDRVSAGEMHPQVLALIAVLGAANDEIDINEPPEPMDEDDGPVLGNPNVNWNDLRPGVPVTCDWHGIKKGKFLNPVGRKKVRIQLETGPQVMRASRVRVDNTEPEEAPLVEA